MCVSCHPEHPAIIAGGTFNGEVRVWNTSLTGDQLLASSGALDIGHKEPVTKVGPLNAAQVLLFIYLFINIFFHFPLI